MTTENTQIYQNLKQNQDASYLPVVQSAYDIKGAFLGRPCSFVLDLSSKAL